MLGMLRNSWTTHNGAVTALFTIVLAISTIGLWSATKKLYDAGERQLEITREAAGKGQSRETALSLKLTEEPVKAANLSAEAAKEQVAVARMGIR